MRNVLLIDFGSTFTKVTAVDADSARLLGRAQSPTTVESDILLGLNRALVALEADCGLGLSDFSERFACSSAAGGLKMAAIGLVPTLTLEAAQRAALGAGAKVVCSYGYEIDEADAGEIAARGCDIVLLCGGTDGGNKSVILHNAEILAASAVGCPILVCGNRSVAARVAQTLTDAGKRVYSAKNVLPALDTVEVAPAREKIREIFIDHIVKAKGLAGAREFIGREIIPTPVASLRAAALLADGTGSTPGIGGLMVVEVGGATTNIHSVAANEPFTPQAVLRGLPEERQRRTVEGDLGIRWNARTIRELCGDGALSALLPEGVQGDFSAYTELLNREVGHVPASPGEYEMDIALARSAVSAATRRHAGNGHTEMTLAGRADVQYGKNLLNVRNLIGTGGIFRYGRAPERILKSALYSPKHPESLRPMHPRLYVDGGYVLYAAGLLAERAPECALALMKANLREV